MSVVVLVHALLNVRVRFLKIKMVCWLSGARVVRVLCVCVCACVCESCVRVV